MVELYASVFVVGLMLADVLSGFLAALKAGEVSSSVMRQGLLKKSGSLLIIALAYAVEHFGVYVGVPAEYAGAAFGAVIALVFAMECVSVVENACKINPDLPVAAILRAFSLDTVDRGEDCDRR